MDVHCFIYVFDARESYIAFLQLLLRLCNLRQVRGVSVPPVLCPIATSIGCVSKIHIYLCLFVLLQAVRRKSIVLTLLISMSVISCCTVTQHIYHNTGIACSL